MPDREATSRPGDHTGYLASLRDAEPIFRRYPVVSLVPRSTTGYPLGCHRHRHPPLVPRHRHPPLAATGIAIRPWLPPASPSALGCLWYRHPPLDAAGIAIRPWMPPVSPSALGATGIAIRPWLPPASPSALGCLRHRHPLHRILRVFRSFRGCPIYRSEKIPGQPVRVPRSAVQGPHSETAQ